MFVATLANIEVSITATEVEQASEALSTIKVGEKMDVICTVEGDGQPSPSISLQLGEEVLAIGESQISYQVTRDQTGQVLVFSCHWEQVGPLGQVLYAGQEHAQPVQVLLPPQVGSGTPTRYTSGPEGINLSVPFAAAPWTKNSKVTWWLLQEDQGRTQLQEEVEGVGSFKTEIFKWGQDKMEAFLSISNLARDISLVVDIQNMGGFTQFPISISLGSPTMSQSKGKMSAVMKEMAWLEINICTVLGIAAGSIFSILLFLQVAFFIRHKRHGCKRFETNKMQFKM